MKDIIDNITNKNNNKSVSSFFLKWKNIVEKMKKREDALNNLIDALDIRSVTIDIKTVSNASIVKKLFDTILRIQALLSLRKLKNLTDKNKKNDKLVDSLVKTNEHYEKEHKNKIMTKLYKLYTYKILNNLFDKLAKMQQEKAKTPKQEFLNSLHINAINGKEFECSRSQSKEATPVIKTFRFSSKKPKIDKLQKEEDEKEKKQMNTNIVYNTITPHLVKYLNDLENVRKKKALDLIKESAKNNYVTKVIYKYIHEKLLPEKKQLFDEFEEIKRIQKTDGPLKAKLFKLLRKKAIQEIFNEKDLNKCYRLMQIISILKVSALNIELAEDRWIRAIIRKWRFIAFSKIMSKKKLEYLYKHFHVNYLEMANNVFGEAESNPSVIKEFERFGSNMGIWDNESSDFGENIKYSKTLNKRLSYVPPHSFKRLFSQKVIKEEDEEKEIIAPKPKKIEKKKSK